MTATPDSQIDHLWHLYGQVDQQKFQQGYFKAWVEGAVQTGLNTVWVMNHMGGKCDHPIFLSSLGHSLKLLDLFNIFNLYLLLN